MKGCVQWSCINSVIYMKGCVQWSCINGVIYMKGCVQWSCFNGSDLYERLCAMELY